MEVVTNENGQKELKCNITELEQTKKLLEKKLGREPTMRDLVEYVENQEQINE